MKKLNLLIVGSNFGKYHLNASIKSKKFKNISIASPNIFQKKIPRKIFKFKNFKLALKKFDINMIAIASKPKVQDSVLNYLYNKRIFPKFIFLEKPILSNSIKTIKKFPKNSLILTNFIFLFEKNWKIFQKIVAKNYQKNSFEYNWFFKQGYFENKKLTWKINPSEGGGLINYYLPHAIFNILSIFKNVKLVKINKKKYHNKILTYLEIIFFHNNKYSILKIDNKSDVNLHSLRIQNNFNINAIQISNKSTKWLSNFRIFKHRRPVRITKKKISLNDGREEILADVYSKIGSYFSTKNIETNKSLTYKTFELIHKINNKI